MKDLSPDKMFREIVVNDDKDMFKKLFFDFYPALCVFARRYITSIETCEDIVQDTFLYIWKNRKQIEIISSFRNLLITSVKNNCIDHLRKQAVRKNYSREEVIQEITNSPEEIYTVRELEKKLHTALAKLPENVRKAFQLSRFENMTYKQIAEEMSVSQKTVEAYISKALSILRAELRDYLPLALFVATYIYENHRYTDNIEPWHTIINSFL
jgi:RNA polymerase sigma-70 factor (ECF subfamily)